MRRPFHSGPLVTFTQERFRLTGAYDVARLLGVADRTVTRWGKNDVSFTIDEAERYADEVGVHPRVIWANYDGIVARS